MSAIDFKEIPVPVSGAQRDQFELFAREFLESLGFKILIGPDRGPDAGRDLVVQEIRTGIGGETRVKWLVSCKHKTHSGASVSSDDEADIHDRVQTHGCQGFLGFYSTIPSSGLATKLNASTLPFEVQIYDPERIEKHILSSSANIQLGRRFFPMSIARWQVEHPSPRRIFAEEPELLCAYCGKSLLAPKPHGIIVEWSMLPSYEESEGRRIEHLYWCCKGACDRALKPRHRREGLIDGWEDIPDLIIPIVYIRWVMAMLNQQHGETAYSEEAFAASKQLLLNLFPFVSRQVTSQEEDRMQSLAGIPSFLGGLG